MQNSKYMKGVDHADQYLSYYSVDRKTEVVKESGVISTKLYFV